MEFSRIFAVIRRRWWILVVTVLVGVATGFVVTRVTTPEYTSTARLFVSTTGGTSSTESYSGEQFSQARAASYAHMMTSELLAQRVVDELGLPMSAAELSSKVTAVIVPRTVLLDISATDRSPERAAAIANTLAATFIAFAGPLETPAGQTQPRSTITVVSAAEKPSSPSAPKLSTNLFYGALGGFVVGVGVVVLTTVFSRRIRSADELARITGTAGLGPIKTPDRKPQARSAQLVNWQGPEAEGFRRLRVQIEAHDPAPQVLLLASASAGKSAANFAVDLAVAFCEAGRTTAVVGTDPQFGSVASGLGLADDSPGLAERLEGQLPFENVVHSTERSNLFVVPPGGGSDVEPLLSSPAMSGFVDDLRKYFDRIIVVTPAIRDSSAASVLSAIADADLLLVDAKAARRGDVENAVSELKAARAHLVGAVLAKA
ncbi:MAG: Tyrosine-protein kinase CpsD [Mycobacterium sp.]|nr:Tyrosine-protein kinase CpsD [Mycobacterium sp.]